MMLKRLGCNYKAHWPHEYFFISMVDVNLSFTNFIAFGSIKVISLIKFSYKYLVKHNHYRAYSMVGKAQPL